MIDIENAKEEFMKYVNNYDISDEDISRKIYHTFRVMDLSRKIGESLELEEEQIKLAELIGLLHDIGRFEQRKRFKTFVDLKSIDHGELGVQILKENCFLRNFVKENKYDDIIFKSIQNHNKHSVQENLNEEEILYSNIIRDADKLDILYEGVEIFWSNDKEKYEIENEVPVSEEYFNQIKEHKLILRKKIIDNKLIGIFTQVAFIFDFNFEFTFKYVYEQDFINRILNRFDFKNNDTKIQIETVRSIANEYLRERL